MATLDAGLPGGAVYKGPRNKRVVYVGGLSDEADEETLHAAFIPFGDIVEVNISKDYAKDSNRGFGFVEFESEEDADDAIDNMDGSELFGRVLRVNRAKPMQHKLGDAKPVWSAEEWFKMNLKDDPELAAGGGDAIPDDGLKPAG